MNIVIFIAIIYFFIVAEVIGEKFKKIEKSLDSIHKKLKDLSE